jgi:hypothetical protein
VLAEAAKLRSKNMYPALVVDLNCGLRDRELRELRWQQVDLLHKKQLTVGKSKTDAGTGRVIPLNDTVMIALEAHAAWYIRRLGECKPEWFVSSAGKGQPNDPTEPVTTIRTARTKVRDKAKVVGRWHDKQRNCKLFRIPATIPHKSSTLTNSRAGDHGTVASSRGEPAIRQENTPVSQVKSFASSTPHPCATFLLAFHKVQYRNRVRRRDVPEPRAKGHRKIRPSALAKTDPPLLSRTDPGARRVVHPAVR